MDFLNLGISEVSGASNQEVARYLPGFLGVLSVLFIHIVGKTIFRSSQSGLLAAVAVTAPAPALAGVYGLAYLAPVVVLDLFLVVVAAPLWRGLEAGPARFSRRLLLGMVLGLTAVVLGELFDRPS